MAKNSIEWLNSNLGRNYPIKEDHGRKGSSITIPNSFLADLQITGSDKGGRYFISEINNTNGVLDIFISDFSGNQSLKFTVKSSTHVKYAQYSPSTTFNDEIYGKIVVGETAKIIALLGSLGGSGFNINNTELEPGTIITTDKANRVTSAKIAGSGTKLTGDVTFAPGTGVSLAQDDTNKKITVGLVDTTIASNCDCPPNFPEVSSINGCKPDCNGNMNMAGEGIITVNCKGNTITIASTVDANQFCGGTSGIPGPPGPAGPAGAAGGGGGGIHKDDLFKDECVLALSMCPDILVCNPNPPANCQDVNSRIIKNLPASLADPLGRNCYDVKDYYMPLDLAIATCPSYKELKDNVAGLLQGAGADDGGGGGGSIGPTVVDNTFTIADETVSTKKVQFQCSSISSATTRTLTVPDQSGTIALTSDITSTSTFVDNAFKVTDNTDVSKQVVFECSGITTSTTRTLTVPDCDGIIALNTKIPIDGTAKVASFISTVENAKAYTLDPANASGDIEASLPAASAANVGKIVRFLVISTKASGTFKIKVAAGSSNTFYDNCVNRGETGKDIKDCVNKMYQVMCATSTSWTIL